MDIVQAKCPHCGNMLRIPAGWLEKAMRCKHCKNTFQAKAKSSETAPSQPKTSAPIDSVSAPTADWPPADAPSPHQPVPQMAPPGNAAVPPQYTPPPAYGAPGYPPAGYYPPPGYPQPGYPQPGYPQPGYPPQPYPGYQQPLYPPGYPQYPGYPAGYQPMPGYAPPPAGPDPSFGFDDSAADEEPVPTPIDGFLNSVPTHAPAKTNGRPMVDAPLGDAPMPSPEDDGDVAIATAKRRAATKKSATVPMIIAGVVTVLGGIVLALLFPLVQGAIEHDPTKAASSKPALDKKNRLAIQQSIADAKKGSYGNVAGTPRPMSAGSMPRRALVIAPVNYLFHNSTPFYQSREGSGAGENALLYRFTVGAPFGMDKNQVFFLSDISEGRYPAAPPQKETIEAAIKDFCASSRPQDRVILFFSGHACDVEDKGYLIPIEGDKDDKESLIPIDWVYDQLAKCKARQKVLVLDAFRFPPARGLELPATGPMTEAVDKQLENPPAGVQVITACLKDQQALEFEAGSLFQTAMLDAFRKMALGAIVQPKDPLPVADLVDKANAFMKEQLRGGAMMAKEDMAEGTTQTCRLSGKEADGGAEPNSADPPAATFVYFKSEKNAANVATANAVLKEIQELPPMKLAQAPQLASLSMAALPGATKDIEEYKDDGFNPFAADQATIASMKEKYPIRVMVYQISTKLKEFLNLPMREVLSNPGGPLDAKAKGRFLLEQKDPALALLDLEELLADAKKLDEKREAETSKRWQAHFDMALARLQSRLVYIYEYNNLIALIRNDSLPNLGPTDSGWRVNTSARIQIKESSVKAMAKDTVRIWDRLAADYPGTPWAVIAKRERNVSMGLQWVPTKE